MKKQGSWCEIDKRWMRDSNRYECDCGQIAKRNTYLWSNQFGFKKRVFCDSCGQWTDIRFVQSAGWSKDIRKPSSENKRGEK